MRVPRSFIVLATAAIAFASTVGTAAGAPRASVVRPAPASSGASDVTAFGDAVSYGSTGTVAGNSDIVGMARTPGSDGYWLVASDGGVFAFGGAKFYGSMGGRSLHVPVVGIAATPSGKGYWLVAGDGGVFTFGDAKFHGSTGALALVKPIVAIAPTPSGKGYWLAASDGGVFAFGDARFFGSTGATTLVAPMTDMVATKTGKGYWLAASDGGVFAFGDARFFGSMGGRFIDQPVTALTATPTGEGYWLAAADGGVFTFGDATFKGSGVSRWVTRPIVDMVATGGDGYWLTGSGGVRIVFARGEELGVARRDAAGRNALAHALRELFRGPNAIDAAAGLRTLIPSGTELLGVRRNGSTATVNLSSTFTSGGGSLSMQLRVAQVVYTVTGFPGVTNVAFEIDGHPVDTIGGEGVVVSPPVDRTDFEAFLPSVYVEYPSPGEVYGAPGLVTGLINAFEGVGIFELHDANGALLARNIGMGEMGAWRPFATVLDFTVRASTTPTGTLNAIPSTGLETPNPPDAVIPVRFR